MQRISVFADKYNAISALNIVSSCIPTASHPTISVDLICDDASQDANLSFSQRTQLFHSDLPNTLIVRPVNLCDGGYQKVCDRCITDKVLKFVFCFMGMDNAPRVLVNDV